MLIYAGSVNKENHKKAWGDVNVPLSRGMSLQALLGLAWREARQIGEPLMVRMAAGGEFLIAAVRLGLLLIALPLHLLPAFEHDVQPLAMLVHLLLLIWAGLSIVMVRMAYRPWMGWLFSILDVSLISAGLAAFAIIGMPHLAVDSRILFECYFLAIAFCGLRYDWRLCAVTGLLAATQYLVLVSLYSEFSWLAADIALSFEPASWPMQLARTFVLLGATLVVCVIVMRGTQLRRQSMTDGLTGIHNRGYFDRRYAEEVERARRFERPLTVCLVDVDRFKSINDQFGHPTGDRILRVLARHLKMAIRESDVVARIGGEEFAILFPESDAASVRDRLQRLRESISGMDWLRGSDGTPHPVTCSMGVATYPADGANPLTVFDRADERLLQAKNSGRNCIIFD